MRLFHVLLMIIGMISAVTVGWFYDNRPILTRVSTLQVPDNIDYYLSAVKYRSLDELGKTRYQLQSPYLEHYIREDRSLITHPDIHYFIDTGPWHIRAQQGELLHKTDQITLTEQVSLQRIDAQDPMQLQSDRVEFNPQSDTIHIPNALTVKTDELNLQADSALMNMKHKRHQFNRVKSIYRRGDQHVTS